MNSLPFDAYQVLAVSSDARAPEIKAAYQRLVRENPPERDASRFQLVADAFRILSNPERRAAYDRERARPVGLGAVANDLFARVMQHQDEDAAKSLWKLAKEHTSDTELQFLTGIALDSIGKDKKAVEVFDRLFDADPSNARYAVWLGDSLVKSGRRERGLSMLQTAITLDAKQRDAYLCLAVHLRSAGDITGCLAVAERACRALGSRSVEVLPVRYQALLAATQARDRDGLVSELRSISSDIRSLPRAEQEMQVPQLMSIAQVLDSAQRLDLALPVVELAAELAPEDTDVKEILGQIREPAKMRQEHLDLLNDEEAPQWLRMHVFALTAHDDEIDKDGLLLAVSNAVDADLEAALRSWKVYRRKYPRILAPLDEVWEGVEHQIDQAKRVRSSPPKANPKKSVMARCSECGHEDYRLYLKNNPCPKCNDKTMRQKETSQFVAGCALWIAFPLLLPALYFCL